MQSTYWTDTPKMARAAASSGMINEWAWCILIRKRSVG
jgi:hypothetical protein